MTLSRGEDDFTDLLHPTLQTKSSFFVLKVENIMIELTIYIHTPYMLNTVNFFFPFIIFDFLWLVFVTRDYTRIIVCSSFKTLFSASMDDFKCSSVKEQNKQPFMEEGKIPGGCFRRWVEKGWAILFLSSSRVFMALLFRDALKMKST